MKRVESYYKVVDFDAARKSGVLPSFDSRPRSRNNTGFVKTVTSKKIPKKKEHL